MFEARHLKRVVMAIIECRFDHKDWHTGLMVKREGAGSMVTFPKHSTVQNRESAGPQEQPRSAITDEVKEPPPL